MHCITLGYLSVNTYLRFAAPTVTTEFSMLDLVPSVHAQGIDSFTMKTEWLIMSLCVSFSGRSPLTQLLCWSDGIFEDWPSNIVDGFLAYVLHSI